MSEVKYEQLGYHVRFACVKDRIIILNERNSTFEHESSRWFSFNPLMFVCLFSFFSLFFIPTCIKRQTDLADYVQRESVSCAREAGLEAKFHGVFAVDTSVDEVWHRGRSVSQVIYGGLDAWPPPLQSNLLSDDTEESVWSLRLLMVLKGISSKFSYSSVSRRGPLRRHVDWCVWYTV